MKRLFALLLALSMLMLCGCGNESDTDSTTAPESTQNTTLAQVETTEETTEASETTSVPETDPEEDTTAAPLVYRNPLNGQVLDEPYTGRVFAYSISNTSDALPHVGAIYADVLMEMFVNNSIIRCIGLYTNIADVNAIGSTRSTRPMFNDIAQHYDAILCHAGGSDQALSDVRSRGVDHFNVEYNNAIIAGASYRDKTYGRGHVHSLFGVGSGLVAYSEQCGFRLTQPEGKTYGLTFTEDGTPANGESAEKIDITITYDGMYKLTTMQYDSELGQYVYYQYKQKMQDQITGAVESFENVVVMFTDIWMDGIYECTEFTSGGTGYYACGGKIIPIKWSCAGDDQPFEFFTEDGEPISFGVGRTYIAITENGSNVAW